MKSGSTNQLGSSSPPQRMVRRSTVLVAAAVMLVVVAGFVHLVHGGNVGLELCAKTGWALGDTFVDLDDYGERPVSKIDNAKVLEAMYDCGAIPRPAHEDAEPGREVASRRAPPSTERTPPPRPSLPEAQSADPVPAQPRAGTGFNQAARRKLTQSKVEKYVHEAYPAWLRAHPGEMCPQQLSDLDEYTGDHDANDAWGRPLRMLCGDHWAGKKHIEVISLGRDGEARTEDDIRAEQ